jgi:predicted nucleotidyltransferase
VYRLLFLLWKPLRVLRISDKIKLFTGPLPHPQDPRHTYYTRVFRRDNYYFCRNVIFLLLSKEVPSVQTAGVIVEFDPLHPGHVHLLAEIRRQLGADAAVIGVMSGNFVQRGDFAVVGRQARAGAAVQSGMDLVLELPLPWAVSSAERFADGGVQALAATGVVDRLVFGSECGDAAALERLAAALLSEDFPRLLRRELEQGDSFAAARQRAAAHLTSQADAALLSSPNNILGVEYCKALLCHGGAIRPLAVPRVGDAHRSAAPETGGPASATAIRNLLRAGERDRALALMAPPMAAAYQAEEDADRAPVWMDACQRAILARLRSMTDADFAALDQGREGLSHRLCRAARTAASVEAVLDDAKTKRYARSRLRRMVLWAYLGLTPADCPATPPYLRVLAANAVGRALLARMRQTATVPILTKPNHVRRLDAEAQELFALEARAADLYALAYPDLSAAAGGSVWREGPVLY